jgi:hypothetical protein
MEQTARYIAFQMPQPVSEIVNIWSNTEAWKKATIFSVGDIFDIQCANKARENALTKAVRKSQRTDGKGPKHKDHMQYIFVASIRETIRRFPFMRQKLEPYDPEYVAYRNRVDENKRARNNKKKVGIRFG